VLLHLLLLLLLPTQRAKFVQHTHEHLEYAGKHVNLCCLLSLLQLARDKASLPVVTPPAADSVPTHAAAF
jgi:hypothetical protein